MDKRREQIEAERKTWAEQVAARRSGNQVTQQQANRSKRRPSM